MSKTQSRIRILFAVGAMYGGGTERQIVGFLKHIDRARYEPMLYLIYRMGELLPEVPDDVPVFAFDNEPEKKRLWIPGLMHLRHVHNMAQVIRREKIDVVYDRTWHMSLVSGEAVRKTQTPRISVIVTDPVRDFPATAGRFRKIKFKRLKRSYHEASQLVAVSDGVKQTAADFYDLPHDSIRTSYNFLDLDRLKRLSVESKESPAPETVSLFQIVTAGRLHEQKGMIYLLQAIRQLVSEGFQQVRLDILGDGELAGSLKQFVKEESLQTHVEFHGFQKNPIPWFKRSHLFCLPSLFEGMPNSLLEAMAVGVPVLAADCPSGPREVLRDGEFGRLVPPADSLALKNAIADAIGQYSQWQALTKSAADYVQREFSPAAGLSRLEAIVSTIRNRPLA